MRRIGPVAPWLYAVLTLPLIASAGEEELLPLPQQGPPPERMVQVPSGPVLFKPSTSIKPPSTAAPVAAKPAASTYAGSAAALFAAAQAAKPRVTLKRLVVVNTPAKDAASQAPAMAARSGANSVTLVGLDAPVETLRNLDHFFGTEITPDAEKKLLETLRQGVAKSAAQPVGKVEILGLWPEEGVLAVGVYPEG